MEVKFTAEEIIGLAVMMNNGTVPFMGVSTILPQGVENVYKWKPSFMYEKVIRDSKQRFEQMGIMESYNFTNLTYVMLKSKYQISLADESGRITESIFLADNNMAGRMEFGTDGTYTMTDDLDQKMIVDEMTEKAKKSSCKVYLRERLCKPLSIEAGDIEEIFSLMHV